MSTSIHIEQRNSLKRVLNHVIDAQQIVESENNGNALDLRRLLQEKLSVTRQEIYELTTCEQVTRHILMGHRRDALEALENLADHSRELHYGPTVPSDESLSLMALIAECFVVRARTYLEAKSVAESPIYEG